VASVEQADPRPKLPRHVDDSLAFSEESLREGRPTPWLPSTAQIRSRQGPAYLRIAE
jgi:hypothetical protein